MRHRTSPRSLVLKALLGVMILAGPALAAEKQAVEVPLPPIPDVDLLAWTAVPGQKLLMTTDGTTELTYIDRTGAPAGELYLPLTRVRDLKSLADGSLVVGDGRNGRIYHVRDDGTLIGSGGERGFEPGQFLDLRRVDADSKGRLYGLDGSELKVFRFSAGGELIDGFDMENGPIVDSQDRLLSVEDRTSTGIRKVVALEAPGKYQTLFATRLNLEERWEAVAGLANGDVLMRTFDVSGASEVLRITAKGKRAGSVRLVADALLAGPSRVIAISPDEEHFVYLAGSAGQYRAIWVALPQ